MLDQDDFVPRRLSVGWLLFCGLAIGVGLVGLWLLLRPRPAAADLSDRQLRHRNLAMYGPDKCGRVFLNLAHVLPPTEVLGVPNGCARLLIPDRYEVRWLPENRRELWLGGRRIVTLYHLPRDAVGTPPLPAPTVNLTIVDRRPRARPAPPAPALAAGAPIHFVSVPRTGK